MRHFLRSISATSSNGLGHARAGYGRATLVCLSLGVSLGLASCLTPAAFRTGSAERQFYVNCTHETARAEEVEEGLWRCPSGAAYNSHSLGWMDESGQYVASVPARRSPAWVNFCDTIALAAYGGYEPDPERPWLVVWGDAESGWSSAAEVATTAGHLDCQNERFFYVLRSTCYVLERGQAARPVDCQGRTFLGDSGEWDFVDTAAVDATAVD